MNQRNGNQRYGKKKTWTGIYSVLDDNLSMVAEWH
jgi:hypothetical protein